MITVEQLAGILGASFSGDGGTQLYRLTPIQDAVSGDVTFLSNKRYEKHLATTEASAIIVQEDLEVQRTDVALIRMKDPYVGFVKALYVFFPAGKPRLTGIHPSAVVDASAHIADEVSLGACVVIGENVSIGKGSVIMAGTVLTDGVTVGEDCLIYPNVSIQARATIGNRVIIHAGTTIGSDGFGFAPVNEKWQKIPQVGTVIIDDDVEIGANCTIDRATLGVTRIHSGTKLDNLIQIGHNVEIGENSVMAGQAGISGSTSLGKHVIVAGQVGIAGHLHIGDEVTITAQSGVGKSLEGKGKAFRGTPVQEMKEEMRMLAAQRFVPDLIKTVQMLEKKVAALEAAQKETEIV